MSTSDYKMEIDNPMKEKAIKTAVNDISSDMEAMSKDLSSINEQLPALVATRTEINDFKNKVETYDKKFAEATAVINNGVDVRVNPAKLSGEDVQMLEDLRSKLDRWNQRWENLWKAIANTAKIKIYLTGILSSALSVCITLLICYDSSYIWAHRAFIASEAKYDDNPGEEYSKTFIDMKGGKADRFLHTVYVKPLHRRMGIGTAIVKKALSIAKKDKLHLSLGVNPLNKIAMHLYESLGFNICKNQSITMDFDASHKTICKKVAK